MFPAADARATAANPTSIDAAALAQATLHGDVPSAALTSNQLAFGERVFRGGRRRRRRLTQQPRSSPFRAIQR